MIVRSRHRSEVKLAGESEDRVFVSGGLPNPARTTVRDLDAGQTDWTRVFAGRDANNVARHCEKEDRGNRTRLRLYDRSSQVGGSNSRSTGIRSKQERMLVTVPKLDSRKKRHAVAGN
jgi:hypothetical protein